MAFQKNISLLSTQGIKENGIKDNLMGYKSFSYLTNIES